MRKYYSMVIGLLLISCNQSKSIKMELSNNEQVIHQYFDLFNKHDWKKMADLYVDNAEFKDPTLGVGVVKQTKQQIIDKYSELNMLFPDLKDKIIQMYPSGDNHIIVEFVSTGTAVDNSKFEMQICTIFTIENGLITKDFTYFDNFHEQEKQ